MTALKCAHCGFTGFADQGRCKSCGQDLSSTEFRTSSSASAPQTRKTLKLIALFVILGGIITGGVVVAKKISKHFDPADAYIESITKSAQFKEPVTIRVNQNEIRSGFDYASGYFDGRIAGKAVRAVDVLEALGLLRMSIETSSQTMNYFESIYGVGSRHVKPVNIQHERLIISLTEKGRQEAVNWRETDEPYEGVTFAGKSITRSWWRIPIGERQITRIESATDAEENTVNIVFRWRWQPNKLGENFDFGGAAIDSLPQKAHNASCRTGI